MKHNDVPFDPDPPKMARPGKGAAHAAAAAGAVVEHSPAGEKAELVALVTDKPIEVLLDDKQRENLYGKIRAEIAGQVPDLTTATGRGKVKSLAYKIARTRVALDDAGKNHTADLRKKVDAVNAVRSAMRSTLELLQAEASKPLDDWEAAQQALEAKKRGILEMISAAFFARPTMLQETIDALQALAIDGELWGDDAGTVLEKRQAAIDNLTRAIEAEKIKADAERLEAENAALRQRLAEAERQPGPEPEPEPEPQPQPTDTRQVYDGPGIGRDAPPAAEAPPAGLTPIQQARRRALPALIELTRGDEKLSKTIILAIERGDLPGIVATYLED